MPDLRRLSPGDFSFYGFDHRMREVEEALAKVAIRDGEPKVKVVEDGVIVPTSVVHQGGSHRYHGGVLDREGHPVEVAYLRRTGDTMIAGIPGPATVTPACEIDEEVVYLGWLQSHHYGLFLLESLMRAWFLREVDPRGPVMFNMTGQYPPEGNIRRLLDVFGIPKERMLIPSAPTRVRRILVPEPLYELYYGGHERAAEPFRAAAAKILEAADGTSSGQPVYLSRGRLTSDRRIIIGEAELEELLRQNGFLVVYPETMALDEQVLLFNRHTDIFACVGSAAHTVLFALNAPYLHLLTAGTPMPEFFLVPALAGARVTFVSCLGEESDHTFPRFLSLPTLVDYLDNRGFLTKRPGTDQLAVRLAGVHERYHEAWFCAFVRKATATGTTLSPDIELEARRLAATSWPMSWILARHYAASDPTRSGQMAVHFAELLAAESDPERIAHRHKELVLGALYVIEATASTLGQAAAKRLVQVLVDRDGLNSAVRSRAQRIVAEAHPSRLEQ
ncbi:MAG: hypothetical protein QOF73_4773 [Thermomicrobiales bacterium]|nr:hypothetical protein [Thermomicrobiales bacterium]